MELQQIEHREAYVRGRSAAGSRSRRWRVSNKIHIRPVDEGFTYDGILKLRTHFIDPEVAAEIHILGAFSGDELIGTIVYDWMKVYDGRPDKELCVLDAYVLPKWCRRRVFTRLFHAMTQHHQGCRVGGHFVEPHLERMANRYNQTIGGVPTIICLNGTYGVQFGKLRTRQFAGAKGRKEAQKIKAAILRGELAELTETVKREFLLHLGWTQLFRSPKRSALKVITKKPKQREPKTIRAIDWARARYLGGGGYAAIFKVGSNTVAKVGVVDEIEAELQRAYAKLEAALPVLDYKPGIILPRRIRRKTCPCHGPRKEIVACGENCACESEMDVLLMPLADMNITFKEATDLMALMSELQQEHPEQRPWDDRMSNCAKYQGKAVALDFGGAQ